MSPRHLTTYLTLLGFIPGRFGAWCWTVCGLGYAGIVWERVSGASIHRGNDWSKVTQDGVVGHLPQLVLGIYRLERSR